MAELIYAVATYAMAPLVSIAFVLIVFLIAPKVPIFPRAFLASLFGSIFVVGPGMYYNWSEGLDNEANPIIYFSLFWIPALVVSWITSWLLAKRIKPSAEDTFR